MPVFICFQSLNKAALITAVFFLLACAAGCAELGLKGFGSNRTASGPGVAGEEPFPSEAMDGQDVMYLNRAGVRVHKNAHGEGGVTAGLKKGDKVLTFRTENGYVFIEAVRVGISGWVEQTALTAEVPKKSRPTKKASTPEPPANEPEHSVPPSAAPAVTDPDAAVSDSF